MHSAWLRCFAFLCLVLSCCEAAPSTEKEGQVVRVYPISEEQYERLLQLTDGKNLISEGRLTTAGFTSVRNTLGSGWNSLLRIVGLTSTRTEQPKIDIDGQPLCVMRRNIYDAESLGIQGRSSNDEESVINCIVVLKRDPALQTLSSSNPDFAPYWYTEQSDEQPLQQLQPLQQAAQPVELDFAPEAEQQLERIRTTTTTSAPKVTKKKRNKSKSIPKSKSKSKNKKRARPALGSVFAVPASLPTAPYGSAYGGAYPFPSYGQYNPYAAYSQQLPFSPQSAFGQQPYPYSPPYYGQNPSTKRTDSV
ncbi:uncharacterized protein LOC108652657 [Drosophila navojoa]|uniref:uncharacterized protein LOC108652657 n=1 Tax=Drosophila navojoa TaxID=7232 RepID=UPI0011BDDD8E|nr:uncharacterized protein LOC108652657 [Drosophila navojoa]